MTREKVNLDLLKIEDMIMANNIHICTSILAAVSIGFFVGRHQRGLRFEDFKNFILLKSAAEK